MKLFKRIATALIATVMLFSITACNMQGKSAYELAVEKGFKGTELEWLNSLQGGKGQDGEDLNIRDIYDEMVAIGKFEGSFEEFVRDYLSNVDFTVSQNNNTEQIAQNIMSVVKVNAFSTFNPQTGAVATGSGVIFELDKERGDAYVLTNYHVVYNADAALKSEDAWKKDIYVYLYGAMDYICYKPNKNSPNYQVQFNDGISATYVGGSIYYDVAILKISGSEYLKNSEATQVKFGSSDDLAVGEKVYTIGNPAGAGIAVTNGLLSVDSEEIKLAMDVKIRKETSGFFGATNYTYEKGSQYFDYRVLRTDAAINGGNSGGGLFNADGELIGIVNAKTADESIDNMGYALPITQVKYAVDNIMANNGKMKRIMFGVSVGASSSKAEFNEQGNVVVKETVQVVEVSENSLAVGKFQVNDVIKSIKLGDLAEKTVNRTFEMVEFLFNARKGDKVTFKVLRGGAEVTVEFTLDDEGYFKDYSPEYFTA